MENKSLYKTGDKSIKPVFDTRTEEEKEKEKKSHLMQLPEESGPMQTKILPPPPAFEQNEDKVGNNAWVILEKNEENIPKVELDKKLNIKDSNYTEQQALKKKDEEGDKNFRRIKEGEKAADVIAEEKHAFRDKMKSLATHKQLKKDNTIKKKKGKESYRSNSLHAIMRRMDELQGKLEEKVADPQQQVQVGNKSLFEQQMEGISDLMKNIILMCDEYDKSHKPWFWQGGAKARKRMLRQMAEQLREESKMLKHRVEEYKKEFGKGGKRGGIIWLDLLGEVRREQITSGVNGVKVEKGGNLTSDLYIVSEGNKKRYLKREEKVTAYKAGEAFDERLRQIDNAIAVLTERKDGDAGKLEEREREVEKLRREKSMLSDLKGILGSLDKKLLTDAGGANELKKLFYLMQKSAEGFTNLQRFADKDSKFELGRRLYDLFESYTAFGDTYDEHNNAYKAKHNEKLILKDQIAFLEEKLASPKAGMSVTRNKELTEEKKAKYTAEKEKMTAKLVKLEEEMKFHAEKAKAAQREYFDLQGKLDNLAKMTGSVFKILNSSDIATKEAKIEAGENLSKRNVATYRMAKLLNLEHLVAKAELKDVDIDGEKVCCMEMEQVEGKTNIRARDAAHSNSKLIGYTSCYSTGAVRDLSSLQVLDVICGQVDRNDGNYLCGTRQDDQKKQLYLDTVKGIDNDMCFGKLSYKEIVKAQEKMSMRSLEDEDGNLTLYGIDGELVDTILALQPEIVKYTLADLLNAKELDALVDRIKGVQMLLQRQKMIDAKESTKKIIYARTKDGDGTKENPGAEKQWENARSRFELEEKQRVANERQQAANESRKTYLSRYWIKRRISRY